MKLSPDFEKAFQEYQAMVGRGVGPADSRDALAITVLGDSSYTNRVKWPGYNILVDMLREPKVAIRNVHNWGISTSKNAHALRAEHFEELARAMDHERQVAMDNAIYTYGSGSGVIISGSYREHFPEKVKDRLRFLAHGIPMLQDAARLHRYLSKTRSPLFT